MTRLQAYRGGASFELDVPDQTIELNFQVEDLRTPGSRLAPFSLTFGLPFTSRNKVFFGFVDELSLSDSAFNMLQKTEARISDDGLEVLDGILQLKSVDLQKQLFNCSFYSATVDFFQTIRGKRWRDIWTDELGNLDCPLDHTLNSTAVTTAWAENVIPGTDPTLVPAGTIQYPLTDNGNAPFAGYQVRADALQRWGSGEGLVPTNLHPAIKVTWLLDEMLKYAGYTRTADDWFNDTTLNNDNLYIHVGLQSKTIDTRTSFGFQASTTITTVPGENLLTQFNAVTPPNYDPDGLFTSGTYVEFNLLGTYVIDVNIFNPNNQGGQWNSSFIAFNGSGTEIVSFPFSAGQADNGDGINLTLNIPFSGPPEIWYFAIDTQLAATFEVTITYVELIGATGIDGVLDFATIMGEEPLDKWVKGLVETYNLVLKFDERNKTATFLPYDEFTDSGRQLDWTDRIDAGGPMTMYPATEYQKSRVQFLPAETQDHRSIYYTSLFGTRKGEYEYVARNDFATGEHVLNDFFGLARLTYLKWQTNPFNGETITVNGGLVNTPIIIRELWKTSLSYESEYESLPPMLLYYHGIQNTILDLGGTSYTLQFADGTIFAYAPLMTPVSGIAADASRISLEYALTAPDLADTSVIGIPTSGLLDSYWGNYIQSIYGAGSRVLECKMLLSPIDIYRLDFGDEIVIKNIRYRLLSINNYVVGQYAPVDVTLFKSAEGSLYDCDLYPTVGTDGVIVWTDEFGNGLQTLASGVIDNLVSNINVVIDNDATWVTDGVLSEKTDPAGIGDTFTNLTTGVTYTVFALISETQIRLAPDWTIPAFEVGHQYTITRGSGLTGTALCCQAYGWIWNEDSQLCTAAGRTTRDTYGYDTGFASAGTRANSVGICSESVRTVVSNYQQGDHIEERWQMIATTTDSSATNATTLQLQQVDFLVGAERSCSVTVTWMAVQTNGVNKGTATSGEEATLINTVGATSSAFPGTIYSRGATGIGVSILTSDGSDGSKWKVQCSGLAATNIDWFLDVTVREYDQSALNVDINPYAEFQSQAIILFQDDDIMIWNA